MHVAIDGVGNHVGGGWMVLMRTVTAIAADPRIHELSVFCSPLDLVASPAPSHPKVRWVEHAREHRSPRARLAWFTIGLDSEVDRVGADVVLSLNGVGRTHRPRVCLVQQAFAVWGRLSRVRPRTFAAKLALLRRETARSVKSADAVVVQTSWMRRQVWDVLERQAVVLPLGIPDERALPRGTRRGVAFVGADLPYKRRDIAHQAATLAKADLKIVDGVTPAEVRRVLEHTEMLLMTSEVESFGLPIVEAFAAGCPVALPEQPWARAVADNAASYFDHRSPTSAARRIVEGATEPTLLDDLRERGRQRLSTLWMDEPYTRLVDLLEEVAR